MKEEGKFKFRDLKIYASTEWLADNKKKYRQVFDSNLVDYIYAELSFYNKLFDIEDWEVNVELKCYRVGKKKKELCILPFRRKVSKYDPIGYIREGWGNKQAGIFWKKGSYYWEAWIEGVKVSTKYFFVESTNETINPDYNPYFDLVSLKLYEGPYDDIPAEDRVYDKVFYGEECRYIYAEIKIKNILTVRDWQCEIFIKFYNHARELKGQVIRLHKVEKNDDAIIFTAGWGANVKGSWRNDQYTVEVIFMDFLIGSKNFAVGEHFEIDIEQIFINHFKKAPQPQEENPYIKIFQIPIELRTAFQQYLLFFKDFVREAKGKEIYYHVNQVENGLEVKFDANSDDDLISLRDYFDEYLNFAKKNFVGIINVEGEQAPQKIDILRLRLEQQVNNLNMELKYKEMKISLLEERIQETQEEKKQLLNTISSSFSNIAASKSQPKSYEIRSVEYSASTDIKHECKDLIRADRIDDAILLIQNNMEHCKSFTANDLIMIHNQWITLTRDRSVGQISYELAQTNKTFIISSLLRLVDNL